MQRLTSNPTATAPTSGGWHRRVWSELAARWRSPLFRKYAGLLFALLAGLLTANAAIQMYYAWRESRAAISSVQREKAQGASAVIEQFLREIEGQVGWTTHANVLSGATGIDQRRFDFLRLLRQAPAVTELTHIDANGREQLKVSRLAMDVTGSGSDYSGDPRFIAAKANRRHVSAVYFRKESEPYLTLSIAGPGRNAGVTIAEVNLKFIWDVISRIEVGKAGVAYVVDQGGLLIAHPDIGLVLQKTDMSGLDHVAAARARLKDPRLVLPETGRDRQGQGVLTASAPIPSLGWLIMVDQPLAEALTPVRGTLNRSLLVLLGGLTLAVLGGLWLARRMAVPINALAAGAERMGAGDLDHRIEVKTGDEIERLGQAFNAMGARLKESYAGLERKVDERTKELAESLEYQTAISDVLGVIARSPSDLQPVLDQIVRTAGELGQADIVGLRRRDGETFPLVAHRGYTDEQLQWLAKHYTTPTNGALHEAIRTRKTVHVTDPLAGERGDDAVAVAKVVGNSTALAVPLMRHGELVGTLFLGRREPKPFADRQIKLIETFADQAVIAIENARLFEAEQTRTKELQLKSDELTQSLEYQTAISEVLSVISRTPNEVQPVLDAIANTARGLCQAERAMIWRSEGSEFRTVAYSGVDAARVDQVKDMRLPTGNGSILGRSALNGHAVQALDPITDTTLSEANLRIVRTGNIKTVVAVPLMRHGQAIGGITVSRTVVSAFTDRQIALIETFADQAVIAIENARLFEAEQTRTKELTESLEYQTAISSVLGVISRSPNNLAPVLDTIARSSSLLCNASDAALLMVKDKRLKAMAHHGSFALADDRPLEDGAIGGRAIMTRQAVQVPDIANAADEFPISSALAARSGARTVLAVPMVLEGEAIGCIMVRRDEVQPFTDRQIALVETFASQAVIAIENARLFEAEQARTRELQESLEYQTATSEVLGVISRSPNDLQPVLDAIVQTAVRLAHADFAHVLTEFDGKYHLVATNQEDTDMVRHLKAYPVVPEQKGSILARAIRARTTVHVPDTQSDPEAQGGLISFGATRSSLAVPLIRVGRVVGGIVLTRNVMKGYSDREIRLVETFADQAVIAMNNARLFEEVQARTKEVEARSAELAESLEYQTAISDVLGVISRSPSELQPVLDAIVAIAAGICQAYVGEIFLVRGDKIRVAAKVGDLPRPEGDVHLDRTTVMGRSIVDGVSVHVADLHQESNEFPLGRELALKFGHRTILGTPLIHGGRAIGTILLRRPEVRPFTDKQIALLRTFADQAVIAINNVGLFEEVQTRTRELTESLEYQTATSDVLGVIARSPGDIQPVFEEILTTASRLCRADSALLFRVEGEQCHTVASNNVKTELLELLRANPVPVAPESITGRAAYDRRTIHVPDELAAPEFASRRKFQQSGGQRTILAVPLLHEGKAIGVITLFRFQVDPFTQRQIDLVTTFANQAVIAINNVDLFEAVETRTKELARSVEELQSLGAVSRTVSATLDMSQVLETVLENACRMAYAGGGTVYVYDKEAGEFRLEAGHNMSETHIQRVREQPIRMGDAVVGECGARREVVQVADLQAPDAPRSPLVEILTRDGVRAILAVPLLHQGEVIGALVIRRTFPGAFSPEIVRLLEAFAAQSAIAVNNARLFNDIEEKGRQLELASQHKSQFLANMSHELRTPLNAILGYTELLTDGTYGELAPRPKGVLERIDRNGKHLLGLINDVLDLSKIEAGEMQLAIEDYALGSLVQNTITVTEPLARQKGLELKASVTPDLPLGRGDARRLSQVLLNLVGNAIKFTDTGRIDVTASLERDQFRIAVKDTGPGIPPAEQAKIFEKFQQVDNTSTRRKGGSGLGLSISKELVEMHGGTITVSSTVGQGSTFEVRVPRRVCPMKEAS